MEKLIYSRYSNERRREFCIRTDILEDENGRFVKKTALYPEGKAHIRQISRWYRELSRAYAAVPFAANRCELLGDSVRLEYVEGGTLEERLDDLLKKGRQEEARELFADYLGRVRALYEREPFFMTEDFRQVFGDADLPEGLLCAPVTNIDMVCGNLVMTEVPCVLDYEWTFDFPVPAGYVLYRIIHYYLETSTLRLVFSSDEFYRAFGITEECRGQYARMEESFQRYLTGSHVPVRELFQDMTPGVNTVEIVTGGRLQIFYSLGDGFREADSWKIPLKDGKAGGVFDLPEGCTHLRIDPGEEPCAVHLLCLEADGKELPLRDALMERGYQQGDWLYFAKKDPCIFGVPVPEGSKKLSVSMEVYPATEELIGQMQTKLRAMDEERSELRRENQELSRRLQEIGNTKVWKAYRKYRGMVERKN